MPCRQEHIVPDNKRFFPCYTLSVTTNRPLEEVIQSIQNSSNIWCEQKMGGVNIFQKSEHICISRNLAVTLSKPLQTVTPSLVYLIISSIG